MEEATTGIRRLSVRSANRMPASWRLVCCASGACLTNTALCQTLLELVDYVNSAKQPFVEQIMPEVVAMVSPPLVLFPTWHSFPEPALLLCAFEIPGLGTALLPVCT